MDEENKQVTADEVYSYGESTEEPAGEPEEKAEPEPEATGSEDSQDNKFVYQDNQYDYSQQYSRNRNEQSDIDRITDPVCWNSHVFCMGIRK